MRSPLPVSLPISLYVDDLRSPPSVHGVVWSVSRTSIDALGKLEMLRSRDQHFTAISLDHDLGGTDTTRPVMLWMCEHDWWPATLLVHSSNPVGREYLEGMARRYGPHGMLR